MRKTWAVALTVALGTSTLAVAPAVAGPSASANELEMTVLATTDVHGNVANWDYFKDAPYSDKYGNAVGLAQAASAIRQVREAKGAEQVVVVDNGDALQGTPLSYYYAKQEPVTASGLEHPMAAAFDAIGYDANNLGNHEFNYGLPLLDDFASDVDSPVLAANVVDVATGRPRYQPYTIVERKVKGHKPVKVGILGLTTPGSMVWDRANLEGRVRIDDMVEAAHQWVPKVRAAGADVVVVLSHSGQGGLSSYNPAALGLGVENVSDRIAAEVPGIDAVVMGHSHQEVAEQFVTNKPTGRQVLMTQPRNWAQSVAEITFDLRKVKGRWQVASASSQLHATKDYPADRRVMQAITPYHDKTVDYVNQVIATSTQEMSAATSRYQDTAILDYIQMVQADAVTKALAGGQYADLPVLSIAAPFSRTAVFGKGDVTVRDMAGLYIYDNTLEAVVMTGAQVKDYLEYSAKYFGRVPSGGSFDPETMTQVPYQGQNVWDYNYDIVAGLDYEIELTRPVGQRITKLTLDGVPVAGDQQFVVAVNNYRRSGGGNFPHIATAAVVHQQQQEIRQLLIDWAQQHQTIDADAFFEPNWQLTVDGRPAV